VSRKTDVLTDQLKGTCKITEARWAAILEQSETGWIYAHGHGLSKARQKALLEFAGQPKVKGWMAKAIGSEKVSSRKSGELSSSLGSERVYLFGAATGNSIMVVGASELDKNAKGFFRLLAKGLGVGEGIYLSLKREKSGGKQRESRREDFFSAEERFDGVLTTVAEVLPVRSGYLTVRSGEDFIVEAVLNIPGNLRGKQIAIKGNSILETMVESQMGRIVKKQTGIKEKIILSGKGKKGSSHWMISPLVIGRRVIGYLAFEGEKELGEEELQQASRLAEHVARPVEKTVVYVEAARYLQRFAVLNELASVASVGLDLDDLAQRVRQLILRTFSADAAGFLLMGEGGQSLQEHDGPGGGTEARVYPVEGTLVGGVVESGNPLRENKVAEAPRYWAANHETKAKMAVPLKFRNQVIGVLSVESKEAGVFSREDENFLMVIGSQVASFIENARLIDKTRQRTHNLSLINEIVQQVVGLTGISEISKLTSKLIAERFHHEMVAVALLDEAKEELVVEGMDGNNLPDFPEGFRYAKQLGVTGLVLEDGKSRLLNDVSKEAAYFPLPGWEPGSEMCVALRAGEDVFGIINVESQKKGAYSENDLLALEALAGTISSVLMYARRYDQLQNNIRQLEAVRATALDVSTDLDLDILLRRVVNRVRELVDARGAELALVDQAEKYVQVLVSENPWQDYTGYIFPLMSGVAGRVAAMGKPLVVEDYNAWSGKQDTDFKAPFTTVAGVPLTLSGETIGTLTVQDDRPTRSFGDDDVQVLELLAPQVTVFIRNARLYQELEERIEMQRLAESRLVQSAKLAAVGEMAAGVAHELNNPLTTVTGFAELILDDVPEDFPQRHDLELVLQEALRARSVVRRLLDFSRQEDILRVHADINEVLSDVMSLIHHLGTTSGVEMRIELWDGLPRIRVNYNQMQQVFLNLAHNAVQAMPKGGDLVVRTSLEDRDGEAWVAINIRDTGEGIAEENLPRIFEPFFTTKGAGVGTGLGLSISYGIVSEHGGFIDVESQEGKGANFTVWLPVEVESEGLNV